MSLHPTILHQILSRAGFSPITKRSYERIIDRWIEFAGVDPSGWTLNAAQTFYDQLIEDGLSVPSANVYIDSLRYVSKWYATKTGGIDFAVVQKQRGTKGKTRSRDGGPIMSESEASAMIETCSSKTITDRRDLTMLVIMLETGMRRMSICGMDLGCISQQHGYPSVTVPVKGPGGEETFDVPLSDVAFAALSAWTAELDSRGINTGPVFQRVSSRVIRGAMSLTKINEVIEGRAKLAGIRHINPHMFRHTFISWRSMAGFSPLDIAKITGHKVQVIITPEARMSVGAMQTYLHRDISAIRNSTPLWLKDLVQRIV